MAVVSTSRVVMRRGLLVLVTLLCGGRVMVVAVLGHPNFGLNR